MVKNKEFMLLGICVCSLFFLLAIATPAKPAEHDVNKETFTKQTYTYKEVDGHKILADVFVPKGDGRFAVVIYAHGG